jgi:hypothetical protein
MDTKGENILIYCLCIGTKSPPKNLRNYPGTKNSYPDPEDYILIPRATIQKNSQKKYVVFRYTFDKKYLFWV